MSNINCLEGWKCPNCCSEGPFKIYGAKITADILMSDEGTVEEEIHSTDWDSDDLAECNECGFEGCVREYEIS